MKVRCAPASSSTPPLWRHVHYVHSPTRDVLTASLWGSCGGFQLQVRESDSIAGCRGELTWWQCGIFGIFRSKSPQNARKTKGCQNTKLCQRSEAVPMQSRCIPLWHWAPCMFSCLPWPHCHDFYEKLCLNLQVVLLCRWLFHEKFWATSDRQSRRL